jgi:hypothetical protein
MSNRIGRTVRALKIGLAAFCVFLDIILHCVWAHDENAVLWSLSIWDVLEHKASPAGNCEEIRIPHIAVYVEKCACVQYGFPIRIASNLKIMEGGIFDSPFAVWVQRQSGEMVVHSQRASTLPISLADLMSNGVTSNESDPASDIG